MKGLKAHTKKNGTEPNGNSIDLRRPFWDEFFDNPFLSSFPWLKPSLSWPSQTGFHTPSVDVSEDDKEVCVKAEIPGMSEKDLDLSYAEGSLYLKGEKKEEKEGKSKNTWHRECWQGSFSRVIPLGQNVSWDKAQARYKDGLLTVTVPKKPGAENRAKIPIQ